MKIFFNIDLAIVMPVIALLIINMLLVYIYIHIFFGGGGGGGGGARVYGLVVYSEVLDEVFCIYSLCYFLY